MSDEFPEYTEEVGACKECGNSPTDHALTKFTSTVDVLLGTLTRYFADNRLIQKLNAFSQHASIGIISLSAYMLHAFGIIRYAHDPKKSRSYRSRVIWEEAIRRNIPMEQMVIVGVPTDTYRARIHGQWVYFESLPIPPAFDRLSVQWVGDKVLLKQALLRYAIPAPNFISAMTLKEASVFMERVGAVTVKPRVGTRGRHTTVGVRTLEDLKKAFKSAKVLCAFVSVEENLDGSVCRGTVVNGKLVGFFQADPPVVVGDGTATIRELIVRTNEEKEGRVAKIEMTEESLAFLQRQGYTLEKIPLRGEKVTLGHRTGRLFGGKTRELLDSVHPKLREYLEKAATVLDTPVVGFDLIIENPETDPDREKWGIIEANTLPFIDLHYLPLYGNPSNPAAAIWDLWKVYE